MSAKPFGERLGRAWNELTGRAAEPRAARALYRGAERSRLLADFVSSCLSSDEELRGSARLMRGRARDLARNDALVRQFLNLLAVNVIGARGARLQARVRDGQGNLDERVNAAIEEAWARWSEGRITADRKMTLVQFEHLQLRTAARDGEAFTRFREGPQRPHGLALAGLDADLVDDRYQVGPGLGGPEVRLGVEIDGDGAPTAYYVTDPRGYQPGSRMRPDVRLSAAEVEHHFLSDRTHQMRGMTWLAAIVLLLQHLERYGEAELVAARAGAAAMALIVQTDPSAGGVDTSNEPRTLNLNPGTMQRLLPGEDVRSFTPNHPTTAFGDFTKSIERRIATGLAVSYNTLANDLEGVNYSSMRSGLQIERDVWRMLQEWWIASFRQPIFERWLQTAILSGELRLPSADWRAYRAVRWVSRGWKWVDPLKDAQAAQIELKSGLTSRQRILAERGEDFEEILEELEREQEMAKTAGVNVSGVDVVTVAAEPADEETTADEDASAEVDGVAEVRALRARDYYRGGRGL